LRAFFIRKILDARFSLSALQNGGATTRVVELDQERDGARLYEAMRERQRLDAATAASSSNSLT
jgi:hypothetical protein